jgi:fructose-specific component phosphotransferase system IIB-like protein
MTRLTALGIALAPFVLIAASTAAAQDETAAADENLDDVNLVIIYGDDKCPASVGGEIVICERWDEAERYRIPENLRESSDPANQAWTERVKSFETVGNFGTMSCTPTGYGGWTGCTQQLIEAAYAERRGGQNVRAAQLIEEARQERLSAIDAEAAAEQARVEVIEKEYEARLAAERDARAPGEATVLPTVLEGAEQATGD